MAGRWPNRRRMAGWLRGPRRWGRIRAMIVASVGLVLVVAIVVAVMVRERDAQSSSSSSVAASAGSASSASSSASSSSSATSSSTSSASSSSSASSLTDARRSELSAKAAAVAKASGKDLHHYVYCIGTRGDVGDTTSFADTVFRTLNDARGWARAGATFTQASSGCDMTIYLAASTAMKSFSPSCSSDYSCRVGDSVIINLSRWDSGVSTWLKSGGTLARYRTMVINHEVGHRLGHRDNETTCSATGARAPLMQEQSMSLRGCVPNEWPLDDELWVS